MGKRGKGKNGKATMNEKGLAAFQEPALSREKAPSPVGRGVGGEGMATMGN
jgi:hypothetical protein